MHRREICKSKNALILQTKPLVGAKTVVVVLKSGLIQVLMFLPYVNGFSLYLTLSLSLVLSYFAYLLYYFLVTALLSNIHYKSLTEK